MSKRTLAISALSLAAGLLLASSLPAGARPTEENGGNVTGGPPTPGGAVFLVADMKGADPPPTDPDGTGRAVFRIQGTQVCWLITWRNIGTPMVGHIHLGEPGVNGPIVVGFWRGQLPDGITGVTGCSTSTPEVVAAILANPAAYYANVHNTDFPVGAIRAQLRIVNQGFDFNRLMRQPLVGLMDGMQEVPGAGDQDGRGVAFIRVQRTTVRYAVTWSAIAQPAAGHIHIGATAQAGPIVVPFFSVAGGMPAGINGVIGEVAVNATVARIIQRNPGAHYANLHNAEFPAGAIRGQLFRVG